MFLITVPFRMVSLVPPTLRSLITETSSPEASGVPWESTHTSGASSDSSCSISVFISLVYTSRQAAALPLSRSMRLMVLRYRASTFALAHGVRRRNVRLDLMLGFSLKQLMRMRNPSSSKPYCSTRNFKMVSRVMPWRGLWGWEDMRLRLIRVYFF